MYPIMRIDKRFPNPDHNCILFFYFAPIPTRKKIINGSVVIMEKLELHTKYKTKIYCHSFQQSAVFNVFYFLTNLTPKYEFNVKNFIESSKPGQQSSNSESSSKNYHIANSNSTEILDYSADHRMLVWMLNCMLDLVAGLEAGCCDGFLRCWLHKVSTV